MQLNPIRLVFVVIFVSVSFLSTAFADENLLGYVRGAETLPKGSWEIYQILTSRNDKGKGTYRAIDSSTEVEWGATDRLSLIGEIKFQSTYIKDLVIDAYIPKDKNAQFESSGAEIALKYNFLSPAKDDFGLSLYFALEHSWLDKHSGQKKDATSAYTELLLQKYFLEGALIWVGNFGMESTFAQRYHLDGLPTGYEWPTEPEMEIALKAGTGVSYRFIPNWFAGAETLYETEYETEVGQERFSTFAGPSLHYGGQSFWSTLTYFHQVNGGGPPYPDQSDTRLHLIEKTKYEVRFKVGLNF